MTFIVVSEESEIPDAPVDGKPTLVYWNIVGLAMPIRLALAYANVDFVDVRIDAGDPTGDNFNKAYPPAKLGRLSRILPFPNLPYFLDGEVCIAQTNTILRHVARKYGIVSPNEAMTDYICDHLSDLEAVMVRLMYGQSCEALLEWYKTSSPAILAKFSEIIQADGTPFLTGEAPKIDDFKLYAFLHKVCLIQEELGNDETNHILAEDLIAYMKRIEALPTLKEYLSSTKHLPKPVNNPIANWIGK